MKNWTTSEKAFFIMSNNYCKKCFSLVQGCHGNHTKNKAINYNNLNCTTTKNNFLQQLLLLFVLLIIVNNYKEGKNY